MTNTSARSVDAALLVVAITWGSSYLAAKGVVPADGVFAFLVLRFAIAVAGLALLLAPRLRGVTRSEVVLGCGFGVLLSAILIAETFGITKTSAANAGLIISLTIVVTPLLDRGRPPRGFYWAAGLAVAGVGVLTQSGGFNVPSLGDLLIALAAVLRSVHVSAISRGTRGRTVDSARLTLIQLCCALVIFIVFASFTGRSVGDVAAHLSAGSWLVTGYLALVCTVLAFVVQIWAARRVSPTRISLLLGTEPLWAAGFGVLLAGDPVTVVSVAGALMILLGTHRARRADGSARREQDVLSS